MKYQGFIKRWDNHFFIPTLLITLFSVINANAETTTINNTNNISAAKADSIIAAIENKLDKTQYGFYNIVCKDGYTLNYRLFKPASTPNVKYPLVITLPGSGSEGTNNTTQMGGVGASLWGQPEYQALHPHYSVVPQPSALIPDSNWKNSYAYEYKQLRDTLIRMYPDIDTTRIYLTGFSAGASMVYRMLGYFPTSFAAGVPGDGAIGGAHEGYEAMGIWPEIYVKNNTPIWMFNGGLSDAVKPDQINGMNNIADSITLHGGNPRTTNMPNLNHAQVEGMYKLEPGLFDWLFAQKREVTSNLVVVQNLESLKVNPNPAYDYISIQGSFEELKIYDMIGREVLLINKSSGKIDVSFLKQGIYIIKSKNNICKFVKI
jgi:hypothetical protein